MRTVYKSLFGRKSIAKLITLVRAFGLTNAEHARLGVEKPERLGAGEQNPVALRDHWAVMGRWSIGAEDQ
jgi:hypothetical protein